MEKLKVGNEYLLSKKENIAFVVSLFKTTK